MCASKEVEKALHQLRDNQLLECENKISVNFCNPQAHAPIAEYNDLVIKEKIVLMLLLVITFAFAKNVCRVFSNGFSEEFKFLSCLVWSI